MYKICELIHTFAFHILLTSKYIYFFKGLLMKKVDLTRIETY